MMNNTNKCYEVFGVTRSGSWEFQDCCSLEQAERIGRIIRDDYAKVVIREVVAS